MNKMNKNPSASGLVLKLVFYVFLVATAIAAPVWICRMDLTIVSNTYGKTYEIFELFGFSGSIAVLVIAYNETRNRRGKPSADVLPVLMCSLVCFFFLTLLSEYPVKSWDYFCYENAAKSLIQKLNPYGQGYLYPPLLAQFIAMEYGFLNAFISNVPVTPDYSWSLIFYIHQAWQFLWIIIAFLLCYRFARTVDLDHKAASLLTSMLFVFNNPIIRTVRHNQLNMLVLDLILFPILFFNTHPYLSGFFLAVGGHIKLYPLILILPFALSRQWRTVAATIISFLLIMFLQTSFGRDWLLWEQFVSSWLSGSEPSGIVFRNTGIRVIVHNFFQIYYGSLISPAPPVSLKVITVVITIGITGWFTLRLLKREKVFFGEGNTVRLIDARSERLKLYEHSMDALVFSLLLSPTVWEHHYVLMLPSVIWLIARGGVDKVWRNGLAALLIFPLPTFDIFPFSYHRLIGLLLLLILTSPGELSGIENLFKRK